MNILKHFPWKPIIKVDGEKVKVTYKELRQMYNKADYIARVINQVLDNPAGIDVSRSTLMTVLYLAIHNNLTYQQLCSTINYIHNRNIIK